MLNFQNILGRRWKTLDEAWRFAIIAFLIVRLFYALWSWTILTIQPLAVQNIEIASEPVLTIVNLQDSRAYTYLRRIVGAILTFRAAGTDTVADLQTGSVWNVHTGRAVRGYYEGTELSPARTKPADLFPYHNAEPFPGRLLALWQRFDANWYISLAETGYGAVEGDDHFPPLFPLLIRSVTPLTGSAFLAGLLISHLAALYAIKLLYETFSVWGDNRTARRAVSIFLIFPTSFFLFSVYTEPVFLVFALLSFRQMKRRSWAWAGFWVFCAILTRLQAAALLVPMLYLMWREGAFLRRLPHWIGLALMAAGGLFYLFLRGRQVSGDAVPFAEAAWHARLTMPWETYGYAIGTLLSGKFTFIDVLNWSVATLFIFLLIAAWRTIPLEYNLYTLFSLLIILTRIVETQPLISMSRYSLALFPAFFALSLAGENPWRRRLVTYTFLPLALYLSAQFFLWGWVA